MTNLRFDMATSLKNCPKFTTKCQVVVLKHVNECDKQQTWSTETVFEKKVNLNELSMFSKIYEPLAKVRKPLFTPWCLFEVSVRLSFTCKKDTTTKNSSWTHSANKLYSGGKGKFGVNVLMTTKDNISHNEKKFFFVQAFLYFLENYGEVNCKWLAGVRFDLV